MENEKRIIRGPQAEDDRVLVPSDRVISRNAGCWNCKHMVDAKGFWFGDKTKGTLGRRQEELAKALAIAENHPLGENHPKVRNIRRMVSFCDSGVKCGAMVRCGGKGVNAAGEDVGDLVANSFMCRKYVGADGASVAREGERINELPEEVRDQLDGSDGGVSSIAKAVANDERVSGIHFNECTNPNCKGCA